MNLLILLAQNNLFRKQNSSLSGTWSYSILQFKLLTSNSICCTGCNRQHRAQNIFEICSRKLYSSTWVQKWLRTSFFWHFSWKEPPFSRTLKVRDDQTVPSNRAPLNISKGKAYLLSYLKLIPKNSRLKLSQRTID